MPPTNENARDVILDDGDSTSSDDNEQDTDITRMLNDLSHIMAAVASNMAHPSTSDTATGSEDSFRSRLEAMSNLQRSQRGLDSNLQPRDHLARRIAQGEEQIRRNEERLRRNEERLRRNEEELRRREERLRFREEQVRSAQHQAERSRRWCSSDTERIRAEETEEDMDELVVRVEVELSYEGEMEMRR